jgi:hypothetical protein
LSDFVLLDGDIAQFQPTFGAATVVVMPGTLRANGPATVGNKRACIEGDESSISVPGCPYFTPQYSIPGAGTLKIAALATDQKATKSKTGDAAFLLKGSSFTAKFEVQAPAMQPPPGPGSPIPDPSPEYSGSGSFVTINTKFSAV